MPADLQSAPVDRFGIDPLIFILLRKQARQVYDKQKNILCQTRTKIYKVL